MRYTVKIVYTVTIAGSICSHNRSFYIQSVSQYIAVTIALSIYMQSQLQYLSICSHNYSIYLYAVTIAVCMCSHNRLAILFTQFYRKEKFVRSNQQ